MITLVLEIINKVSIKAHTVLKRNLTFFGISNVKISMRGSLYRFSSSNVWITNSYFMEATKYMYMVTIDLQQYTSPHYTT